MKKSLFLLTVTLTAVMAFGEMTNRTALEFFEQEGILAGWNLGNTMEAVNDNRTLAVESWWIFPRFQPATQALFDAVRDAGFDHVRIPATWIGHIGEGPEFVVSEARLARLEEIIGYARNAGFKAVIINIHHDGNYTEPNRGTWGFVDMFGAVTNDTIRANVATQLTAVWTHIANYFKDHGEYLIFETLNEVHAGDWGANATTVRGQLEQDILHEWNTAALNAIRATGGNNARRFVAIPGVGSTEPSYVIHAHRRGKLLPDDGDNGTDRLIVSAHYYHPWQYTVADITGQGGGQGRHTWGTPTERAHPINAMQSLKTTFIDSSIAVYISEWGAQTNVRRTMDQVIQNTHIDYIYSVARAASQQNIPTMIWDDGGNFKMLERSDGKPLPGLPTDVLNALIAAFNGDTIIIVPPDTGTKERTPIDVFVNRAHRITDADGPTDCTLSVVCIGASTLSVTEIDGVMTMTYTISKNTYPHTPFVAAHYSIDEGSMEPCIFGIGYTYKGAAHRLRAEQSNTGAASGWDFHRSRLFDAVSDWTPVEIPWNSFQQEGRGIPVAQDRMLVDALAWHISGADGSGQLQVKDVYCLAGSVSISHRRTTPRTTATARTVSISVRGNNLNVLSQDNAEMRIRVVNLSGRTVKTVNARGNANISLRAIPAGVYIVEAGKVGVGGGAVTRQRVTVSR